MNDMEENKPLIVECPHCYTKVLPLPNNICPTCRNDMSDTQDIDLNQVALDIHETEELPSYCFMCNQYTERHVRISGDKESDLEKAILAVGQFFTRPSKQTEVGSSNVIIYIPQCENCGDLSEPEPIEVDYEKQNMKFVVHQGFRDRVYRLREVKEARTSLE